MRTCSHWLNAGVLLPAFVLGALVLTAPGCGTIDTGPPTGPPMGCNASTDYFVQKIAPNYLQKYTCGRSDCHDSQSGHGYFRMQMVATAPPAPGTPLSDWPDAWRFNYLNAAHELNCSDPLASSLLAVPEGKAQPHQGGIIFSGADAMAAEQLFTGWVTAQ